MSDDEVLAGLIMAAKAEREAGFDGWSLPPANLLPQCDRLVERGWAEQEDEGVHYRPTPEGERMCQIKISRVS